MKLNYLVLHLVKWWKYFFNCSEDYVSC